MRQPLTRILLLATLLCCTVVACTTVDLCYEPQHPHVAGVRARFHWQESDADEKPAEVYIVASRIINTWRTYGIADTNKEPDNEDNILQISATSDPNTPNEPADDNNGTTDNNNEPADDNDGTTDNNNEPADDNNETTDNNSTAGDDEPAATGRSHTRADEGVSVPTFQLRGGEYNLFAINEQKSVETNGTEELASPFVIENLTEYIHDKAIKVNDLYLQMQGMGNRKPAVVEGNDLPDFNPHYEYLQDIPTPIFHAVRKKVKIETGQLETIDFDMQRISQRINVIFNIQTDGNIQAEDISAPIIELSGVCGRFNISEAYIDTTTLYRIAKQVAQEDIKVTEPNTYQCTVHFNTLGIIPSGNKSHLNGPGVLQIAVKVASVQKDEQGNPVLDAEGKPVKSHRYIYAGINPYDELTAAQLVEVRDGKTYMRYSKEDVNVVINTPLKITEEQTVPDDSGMGWTPANPTDPDEGVDIEM